MGKTFGDIVACEDISIDISKDESLCSSVRPGPARGLPCGVSLALKNPMSNSLIDGQDVTHTELKDKNIAFVFQNITFFPHMNSGETSGWI